MAAGGKSCVPIYRGDASVRARSRTRVATTILGLLSLAVPIAGCAEHAGGAGPATPGSLEACTPQPCRPPRSIVLQSRQGQQIVQTNASPYVLNGSILVRVGDDFFVAADEKDGTLINLRKVDAAEGAPNVIHVSFKQDQIGTGDFVMFLTISQNFPRPIVYRAIASRPTRQVFQTSTCPLRPGLPVVEMWPNPIWILALDHFRATDDANNTCQRYP